MIHAIYLCLKYLQEYINILTQTYMACGKNTNKVSQKHNVYLKRSSFNVNICFFNVQCKWIKLTSIVFL